jgi:competence protein ComFC
MNCLLCNNEFLEKPSWQSLFVLKNPQVICVKCQSKFERAENKDYLEEWKGTKFEGALDSLISIYNYNDFMKDVLHQYKFLQDVELAKIFREDFVHLKVEKAMIVPIPMHLEKLKERTFAQVDELLIAANIPFTQALQKSVNTTQGKKSKLERTQSEILFTVTENIEGKSILLVDDLYTTGTTLHHAAYVLKQAGASKVRGLTLVRV